MTERVTIVADDLTGALDSAAPFAMRGARVRIACTVAALPEALASEANVVAVATGTRDGDAHAAGEAARRVASMIAGRGGVLFKKIDSRLKGHIAVELDALATTDQPLVVNPAIPRLGRYCIDGMVTGAGADTPIPVQPVIGRPVTASDARSQADLETIVATAPAGSLFIGAAGLGEALANRIFGDSRPDLPPLPAPALLAIGSRDPVTLAQLVNLRSACPEIPVHAAPNGSRADVASFAPVSVLQMTPGETVVDATAASSAFSRTIASTMTSLGARTLFACGGESAAAVLHGMGIDQLELFGELMPGVPVARGLGSDAPFVVTKSGGFGGPETLVKLVKFLSPR